MRRIIIGVVIILLLAAVILAWLAFGPGTAFNEKKKYLYVYENRDIKQQVEEQLKRDTIIHNIWLFNLMANQLDVWQRLQPGRFEITKGESIVNIVRRLRNNVQSPVRLVINKLRTREDFARVIGKYFIEDSADVSTFVNSNDSLQSLGVDTNTMMTLIIPDTYIIKWNTSVRKILERLQNEKDNFWGKKDRLQLAKDMGYTPGQVYTLASIVEEETNKNDEKGNIASVYMNRLNNGMPLGADPTIKFALRNFALRRILFGHLDVASPYNTYRNKGLPPGPICTPQAVTIDAVLHAPKTDYLYFVAKSDFSGYHHFSSNYAEHQQYAKIYQKALDEWMLKHAK